MHNQEKCPHCGEVITDLDDYNWRRHEYIEDDCGHCEKPITITRRVDVTYEITAV